MLKTGALKAINFPFRTNGKSIVLGVQIHTTLGYEVFTCKS